MALPLSGNDGHIRHSDTVTEDKNVTAEERKVVAS
jgi:hypothetical protein